MSTFDGFVSEFPYIRIDQFRPLPGRPPPLACFLSHVHSDHLAGLESLKSPFVYCSPATRELLLRLEKYPHRMNFSKGILECRKQTYKHLRMLLKTIPLESPTRIELSPGNDIQVTLFDANHCVGAVMFLIEGNGKAILYTGDIRAEPWWINSITRHPKLLPYITSGPGGRRLDRLYFDTTFAVKSDRYRDFPSKAEGLQELFTKIAAYPPNTRFYFHAWTFGYEDVWLALSQELNSRVHLDRYRYGMYMSLARTAGGSGLESREAPFLCGFKCGNVLQAGCITNDSKVRLHSCEKGTNCPVFSRGGRPADDVVELVPIISRYQGRDMAELGAGGGKGDLDQTHELDIAEDPAAVMQLLQLCKERITDGALFEKVVQMLIASLKNHSGLTLDLPMPSQPGAAAEDQPIKEESPTDDDKPLPLTQIVSILSKLAVSASSTNPSITTTKPRTITFPYSRHSSYNELRHLASAFRPTDIYPCVAPSVQAWREADMSMQALFGDCCADPGGVRAWDVKMRSARAEWEAVMRERVAVSVQEMRARRDSQKEVETESEDEDGDEFVAAEEAQKGIEDGGMDRVVVVVVEEEEKKDAGASGRGEQDDEPPKTTPKDVQTEQKKTQSARKRAPLDAPAPHLSPANRMKARTLAYNAAMEGTWAQAKRMKSSDRAEDSDEEL